MTAAIAIRLVLSLSMLIIGFTHQALSQESPSSEKAMDRIVVDGVTVPDIGPLPAYVPMPQTNVNFVQKVNLGKQLYFDGRLSKNNAISCAFVTIPVPGSPTPDSFRSARLVRRVAVRRRRSTTPASIRFNSGMGGRRH